MAHHITTPRVVPPTDVTEVGPWSIRIWSKIIGNNAGAFTAVATNPQGTQLTAHGLTYGMALDSIVKQLPKEPNP